MIHRTGGRMIFENHRLRVVEDDIVYSDGTTSTYTLFERPDFVCVLPYERAGFWMVEQYRYPVGRRLLEFPMGTWPHATTGTPADLAVLELREETGLTAGRFEHLGRLHANQALTGQAFDVFLATDLAGGDPEREHTEQDMVHRWISHEEIRAMIRRGDIVDAHALAALYLFDLRR